MELDDFRRQWQQQATPTTTSPSITEQDLKAMLTSQNTSVSAMERSMKKDQVLLMVVVLLNIFNIGNMMRNHPHGLPQNAQTILYVLVAAMIVFMGWYYSRLKQAITWLQRSDKPTYSHIQGTIRRIRHLLRNRMYASLAFVGSVVLVISVSKADAVLHNLRTGNVDWPLTLLGSFAVMLTMAVLLYIGKQREQDEYGQHLDRLEGALRELEA